MYQRVEKDVGGTYSEYVFNIQGQAVGINNRTNWTEDYIPMSQGRHVAHYAAGAHFMHPDALGTTGIVTSYTGAVEQDELHYPWGQEWTMMGSMKEERYARLHHRDSESDLDPTHYRMYSSDTGRWMTPDPASEASASPFSPQSFNRYGYATGNPSNLVDPWGLDAIYCSSGVLCTETEGYIGINGPLSYTNDTGLTDLCIYSTYGCGYNGGYGSSYPYSNSGYTMPSYGGGSGYVPPSTPPPPQPAPVSHPVSPQSPLYCSVSSQLQYAFALDDFLAPAETRVVPAAGMIVAGFGVAYGSYLAMRAFPSSWAVAVPVALSGVALAVEGFYYGVTGNIYVPSSCR